MITQKMEDNNTKITSMSIISKSLNDSQNYDEPQESEESKCSGDIGQTHH
jgi:hypothetical protein